MNGREMLRKQTYPWIGSRLSVKIQAEVYVEEGTDDEDVILVEQRTIDAFVALPDNQDSSPAMNFWPPKDWLLAQRSEVVERLSSHGSFTVADGWLRKVYREGRPSLAEMARKEE